VWPIRVTGVGNFKILNIMGVTKMADNPETNAPQEQGRAAMHEGTARMSEAGRAGSETVQRTGAATAETLRHLGDAAGETARRGAQRMAGAQDELAQDAARYFEQSVSRTTQVAQDLARDWGALMQLPKLGSGSLQDLSVSLGNMVERVIQTNLHTTQELFRSAGPMAMAELQQRFIRDYLDALLQGSTAVIRTVGQSAEQTLGPLEQRMTNRQQWQSEDGAHDRVADVMEREVKLANPDDNVQQAARMMREADVGVLPVGEGDRLVGMVSDRDIAMRLAAEGRDPARTKVRDVMSPDVRYVYEDEDLEHVAENMAEQQVRRLPVMNRDKRLIGIVSLGDIATGSRSHLAGKALRGVAQEGGQHTGNVISGRNLPKDVPASDRDRQREIAANAGNRS
jgi:CBS domain-containing protein